MKKLKRKLVHTKHVKTCRISQSFLLLVSHLCKFIRPSGLLKCDNTLRKHSERTLNRRKYRDMMRQTFDGVCQYRLVLRHFGTRHSSRSANSTSTATSSSHHNVTRSLPGVISPRSMHRECLQRVCTSLFEKPFR